MGEAKRKRSWMARAAAVGVELIDRDTIKTGAELPDDADIIAIEIAHRGAPLSAAVESAELVARTCAAKPGVLIVATVGGWEDDPREVQDIPEAVGFFRAFALRLQAIDEASTPPGQAPFILNRLDYMTRNLVMYALGHIPRSAFHITPWTDPVHKQHFDDDMARRDSEKRRQEQATAAAAKEATKQ